MKQLFFISFLLVCISCKDIIDEERIYETSVVLVAPVNEAVFTETTVNLVWNTVEGADEYVVQIATPSFEEPLQFVTDSIVTTTNLNLILNPGTSYQWRIKGQNVNYETAFSTRSLEIE